MSGGYEDKRTSPDQDIPRHSIYNHAAIVIMNQIKGEIINNMKVKFNKPISNFDH